MYSVCAFVLTPAFDCSTVPPTPLNTCPTELVLGAQCLYFRSHTSCRQYHSIDTHSKKKATSRLHFCSVSTFVSITRAVNTTASTHVPREDGTSVSSFFSVEALIPRHRRPVHTFVPSLHAQLGRRKRKLNNAQLLVADKTTNRFQDMDVHCVQRNYTRA